MLNQLLLLQKNESENATEIAVNKNAKQLEAAT